MSVLITADIIDESVLLASMAFVDDPITPALIDSVRESVNAFLRTLISRGALIDGEGSDGRPTGCYFDEAKNSEVEIAKGNIVFTLNYCPPTPAERITYDRLIDIAFLRSLVTGE
jgi:phage tail sheath protein FI